MEVKNENFAKKKKGVGWGLKENKTQTKQKQLMTRKKVVWKFS